MAPKPGNRRSQRRVCTRNAAERSEHQGPDGTHGYARLGAEGWVLKEGCMLTEGWVLMEGWVLKEGWLLRAGC